MLTFLSAGESGIWRVDELMSNGLGEILPFQIALAIKIGVNLRDLRENILFPVSRVGDLEIPRIIINYLTNRLIN